MLQIRNSLFRYAIAALLAVGSAGSVAAQNLTDKLPVDPKVHIGVLPNGMTYYVRPNAKPENKVELRLVVNAGSILEDDDQQGLAHFMEHMNFNGTKNFKKNELVSYLQSIGVEFGADLNAYTSFDETVYILPVPTDKEGNLDKGFQIIEDWAHNALLTDADIDDERGVVLEESRMGKGADMRMLDKYLPRMMADSRYAQRLPIGKDDVLKNFKYETIRRFYRDWYRPNLVAVAVVGDIDSATAMKYIRKHFGSWENPKKQRERFVAEVPSRKKAEAMVVTDKEATNYQLQIIFPSEKTKDEVTVGDYVSHIKENLAIQMMNRRLQDLARSSNPPFPYAAVSRSGWARGYEGLSAFTMFGESGPQTAMNALTAEMLRAKQYGFTENELEIAKKNMLSFIEKAYNERTTTESEDYVGEYVRNFLEKEPIPGIENEYKYYTKFIPTIKVEELNNMFAGWMSNMNTFTLITGPENSGTKLPTEAELLAMTQKGFSQKVEQKEEEQIASSLMDKKPAPGKVVATNKEDGFNATTYTLSNGVKVTIKPTDFKSDEILLKGLKKGGTNNYGANDKYNVNYLTQVTSAMGYGDFTPTQLEKVLSGKNVSVRAGMDEIQNEVSANSTVKDFETMLQLLHVRLTTPRQDEALFKAYQDKMKMQMQFLSANPQVSFIDTLAKVYYKNNPLAPVMVPKADHFEALNMDRIVSIYKDEFGTADGYHFFIVGNVDEKTAIPLIETYIGSLPKADKKVAFKDNGVRPLSGKHQLKYNKGSEQKSLILALYNGETKYSEDLELRAHALVEVLNIKVIEELREKLGGIYGGGYNASVEQFPYAHYSIALQLPCGPENVDKLLTAANAEIAKIIEKGPDMADLDKVKNQWHEQHRTSVKENSYWASQMADVIFWNGSKDHVLKYDAWIDELKPADIQKTAKELFGNSNEFISVLYPES